MENMALECKVCRENYLADLRPPLCLPCGHSFCRQCLEVLEARGGVKCPTCHIPHTSCLVAHLPVNLDLLSEIYGSSSTGTLERRMLKELINIKIASDREIPTERERLSVRDRDILTEREWLRDTNRKDASDIDIDIDIDTDKINSGKRRTLSDAAHERRCSERNTPGHVRGERCNCESQTLICASGERHNHGRPILADFSNGGISVNIIKEYISPDANDRQIVAQNADKSLSPVNKHGLRSKQVTVKHTVNDPIRGRTSGNINQNLTSAEVTCIATSTDTIERSTSPKDFNKKPNSTDRKHDHNNRPYSKDCSGRPTFKDHNTKLTSQDHNERLNLKDHKDKYTSKDCKHDEISKDHNQGCPSKDQSFGHASEDRSNGSTQKGLKDGDDAKELSDRGISISPLDDEGYNEGRKSLRGDVLGLQEQLDCGSDVNMKSPANGGSALQLACREGHLSCAVELIRYGAMVNARDSEGKRALHFAAMGGHHHILPLLLRKGAMMEAQDIRGMRAVHLAAKGGHLQTLQALEERGCLLTALCGSDNSTALHLAAEHGHLDVAEWLVEQGLSLSAKDMRYRTAEQRAAEANQKHVTSYLRSLMVTEKTGRGFSGAAPGFIRFRAAQLKTKTGDEVKAGGDQVKRVSDEVKAVQDTIRPEIHEVKHQICMVKPNVLEVKPQICQVKPKVCKVKPTIYEEVKPPRRELKPNGHGEVNQRRCGMSVSDADAKLLEAAGDGDLIGVKEALLDGADVNVMSSRPLPLETGLGAIHLAAWGGYGEVVEFLLKAGANPHLHAHGLAAVHWASVGGHVGVLKVLGGGSIASGDSGSSGASGSNGASGSSGGSGSSGARGSSGANESSGASGSNGTSESSGQIGMREGSVENIRASGPRDAGGVNTVSRLTGGGWTALHLAAHHGNLEAVRWLVEEGELSPSTPSPPPSSATPLSLAKASHHTHIAAYLLSRH